MINKGALAENCQVEMLLGSLPKDLWVTAVMIFNLDLREPLAFKDDKLWKHVLNKCATAVTLALLDSVGARMVQGGSPYTILVAVPFLQMPVVVNHPAISSKATPAPAQAMEEIPIAKAESTMDMKMDNMMKSSKAWTFQMSKANEPG